MNKTMLVDKIKQLERKEKELSELPEVVTLNEAIKEARCKLNTVREPYKKKIEILSDEIDNIIVKRLKLLKSCGYETYVNASSDSLEYNIDGDKVYLETCESYYGETNSYEDEIPLYLFTCSDEELISSVKQLKDNEKKVKLAEEEKEALKKLKEIEEYRRATGMNITEIWSR